MNVGLYFGGMCVLAPNQKSDKIINKLHTGLLLRETDSGQKLRA